MLRYFLVFAAGAAFSWGALAAMWLEWTTMLGLLCAIGFFLFAAVGATAPRGEAIPGRGRHLHVVRKGRAS